MATKNTQAMIQVFVDASKAKKNLGAFNAQLNQTQTELTALAAKLNSFSKQELANFRLLTKESKIQTLQAKVSLEHAKASVMLAEKQKNDSKKFLNMSEVKLVNAKKELDIEKRITAEKKLQNTYEMRSLRTSGVGSSGGVGNGRRFPPASRFNGLSDIGFAGLGVGYAFSSFVKPSAELEKTLDRIESNRNEFMENPNFQRDLLAEVRKFTVNDRVSGRSSPIRQSEFAEGYLKIVKDGIGISKELTEQLKDSNLQAAQQIGTTKKFIGRLSEITSNIARAAGEPESFGDIADIIGELVPKNIVDLEGKKGLIQTNTSLNNFERVVVGALANTRFDVGNLTKAIRNTIGTTSFTDLPIDEIFKLMVAVDRVAPTGRSSGTSVRRFFQELLPRNAKDFKILQTAGIDPERFSRKVSGLNRASDVIKLVTNLEKRLLGVTGDKAKTASLIRDYLGTEADKAFRGMVETGIKGFEEAERKIDEIDVGSKIKKAEDNLINSLAGLRNAFENFTTSLGFEGGLNVSLTNFFDTIGAGFNRLSDMIQDNPVIGQLIVMLLKVIAVMAPLVVILNGLEFVVSRMAKSFAFAASKYVGMFVIINELMSGLPVYIITQALKFLSYMINGIFDLVQILDDALSKLGPIGQFIKFFVGSLLTLLLLKPSLAAALVPASLVGATGLSTKGSKSGGGILGKIGSIAFIPAIKDFFKSLKGTFEYVFFFAKYVFDLINPFKKVMIVLGLLTAAATGAASYLGLFGGDSSGENASTQTTAIKTMGDVEKVLRNAGHTSLADQLGPRRKLFHHPNDLPYNQFRHRLNASDYMRTTPSGINIYDALPMLRDIINNPEFKPSDLNNSQREAIAYFPEVFKMMREGAVEKSEQDIMNKPSVDSMESTMEELVILGRKQNEGWEMMNEYLRTLTLESR